MARARTSGKKKLRVAFIGTGMISGAHLGAYRKMDDVEVVALCDIDKKALAKRAAENNIADADCYTDHRQMLKAIKGKADAVNVCTPNGVHAEHSVNSSKAGFHVIVEKPMAMNPAQCKQMIAAAKAARKKLVIGFQYRYDPKTAFLVDMREAGVFGDIRFGRVQALRRRGIPNWGVFGQKKLQGGGPMIDIGVHVLEMCHFTMGSPKPVAAVGFAETYMGNSRKAAQIKTNWSGWDYKTYTVEDLALGHIRFDNGAVIHIEASFAAHHEHSGTMDFQIMGTKGGAKWGSSEVYTDMHNYQMNIKPAYVEPSREFETWFFRKNRNFVDHILHGKPTMAPAEHGLMVQQMLSAIYESAEKGGKEVLIK